MLALLPSAETTQHKLWQQKMACVAHCLWCLAGQAWETMHASAFLPMMPSGRGMLHFWHMHGSRTQTQFCNAWSCWIGIGLLDLHYVQASTIHTKRD